MIQLSNGWIEIKPIKKSQYTEEVHGNYADTYKGQVYFEGHAVEANGKFFINEDKVIAYEHNQG